MPDIDTQAAIIITADGIAIENAPLIAGERIPVTASGLTLAEGAALTLVLEARAPTFQIANVALVEDAETGVLAGTLETATRQAAMLFATAGADETRPVVLELIDTANRDSLAILAATLRNSALIPAATPCAVGPVYLPVPGPQGEPGEPRTPYDSAPAMDGAASAGSSAAYARGDHRHPVDTSRASVADATLNGRGYSAWTASPASIEFPPDSGETVTFNTPVLGEYETSEGTAYGWYWHNPEGVDIGLDSTDPDATEFQASWYYADITFSRSALPGYVLGPADGPNADKPIPKLSDVPAVVAPSTSASDAGKAADAKATGDALAGKLSTSGGTVDGAVTVSTNEQGDGHGFWLSSPDSGAAFRFILSEGHVLLVGTISGQTFALTFPFGTTDDVALEGDLPSAETWTFEVDDGQGGTTTITKAVAVYAQAAQGGA